MNNILLALISIGIPEEKARKQLADLDQVVSEKILLVLDEKCPGEITDRDSFMNVVSKFGQENYDNLVFQITKEVFDGYFGAVTKNLIPLKRQKFYEIIDN